jgi:hypothetical protein
MINLGGTTMIKTMKKNDFISWETANGYDLRYNKLSALIKFDDISANNDVYGTVGKVIEEMTADDDIIDIRAHWYNGVCVLITGYIDRVGAFVMESCLYIH